jgi:hypothetical protein
MRIAADAGQIFRLDFSLPRLVAKFLFIKCNLMVHRMRGAYSSL